MDLEPRESAPRIVDGYRRDTRRRILLGLVPGFACAMVGAILLLAGTRSLYARDPARALDARPTAAHPVSARTPPPAPIHEAFLLYGGALLCLASPIVLGLSLRRLMNDDDFLILRVDGLVHQQDGRALLYRWDEVDAVTRGEGDDALVLVLRDDSEVRIAERYAGAKPDEVVARVAEVRRRALFGMLPSQRNRAPRG